VRSEGRLKDSWSWGCGNFHCSMKTFCHARGVKPRRKMEGCIKRRRHWRDPNPSWLSRTGFPWTPKSGSGIGQDRMNRRVRTRMPGGVGGRRP
jgi:hypothetical protein